MQKQTRQTEGAYLPGTLRTRITDLCKSRKITQKELADAIGADKSKLSRFLHEKTNSLTDGDVIRIAKYFDVSTDFLLGESDDPSRINYDIGELGLTVQAAKNLYTRKVNPEIVSRILEHERCGELMQRIALYQDEVMASGIAAQNQLLNSVSGMLLAQAKIAPGEKAAALDAVHMLAGMKQPAYAVEKDAIQQNFSQIVQDIRKVGPDNARQAAALTKETLQAIQHSLSKGNAGENLHQVSPEGIVNGIFGQLSVPDCPPELQAEMDSVLQNLRTDLRAYFGILQRAKDTFHEQ